MAGTLCSTLQNIAVIDRQQRWHLYCTKLEYVNTIKEHARESQYCHKAKELKQSIPCYAAPLIQSTRRSTSG